MVDSEDGRAAKRQRFSPSAVDYVAGDANANGEQQAPPSSARASMSGGGTLEPSILNAEPFDEVMREVADWIFNTAQGHANIEIEAKIGLLIDTGTGQRVSFPVLTETSRWHALSRDYSR